MLEKAPESEYGGNARYSGTGFRFWHNGAEEIREFVPDTGDDYFNSAQIPPYTKEEFACDLERMTLGRIDPQLARTLVEESNAAIHWMKDAGIRWELLQEHAKVGQAILRARDRDPRRRRRRGLWNNGAGSPKAWISKYASSPVGAIHGNMHGVEGVRVCTAQKEYDIGAGAIIACAGGFQASAEMRARYLADNADLVKVRGSKHDTGEILNYLLALGAATGGHWQSGHMSPIDAKAPDYETPQHTDGRGNTQSRYDYPFGITVNALGLRFFDEGEAQHSYTYAKTGRAVLGQPGALAYQIYVKPQEARQHRYPHHEAESFEETDDIPELALRSGWSPSSGRPHGRTIPTRPAA